MALTSLHHFLIQTNTIDKDKVCCTQVVSCSQETADNKLPMYLHFMIPSYIRVSFHVKLIWSKQVFLTPGLINHKEDKMTILLLKKLCMLLHVVLQQREFPDIHGKQTSDMSHKTWICSDDKTDMLSYLGHLLEPWKQSAGFWVQNSAQSTNSLKNLHNHW